MNRPLLNEVPMSFEKIFAPGSIVITMSPGQWDVVLEEAYDMNAYLLVVDENEVPVRCYRKPQGPQGGGA